LQKEEIKAEKVEKKAAKAERAAAKGEAKKRSTRLHEMKGLQQTGGR
jgi:hypothetical protein